MTEQKKVNNSTKAVEVDKMVMIKQDELTAKLSELSTIESNLDGYYDSDEDGRYVVVITQDKYGDSKLTVIEGNAGVVGVVDSEWIKSTLLNKGKESADGNYVEPKVFINTLDNYKKSNQMFEGWCSPTKNEDDKDVSIYSTKKYGEDVFIAYCSPAYSTRKYGYSPAPFKDHIKIHFFDTQEDLNKFFLEEDGTTYDYRCTKMSRDWVRNLKNLSSRAVR